MDRLRMALLLTLTLRALDWLTFLTSTCCIVYYLEFTYCQLVNCPILVQQRIVSAATLRLLESRTSGRVGGIVGITLPCHASDHVHVATRRAEHFGICTCLLPIALSVRSFDWLNTVEHAAIFAKRPFSLAFT